MTPAERDDTEKPERTERHIETDSAEPPKSPGRVSRRSSQYKAKLLVHLSQRCCSSPHDTATCTTLPQFAETRRFARDGTTAPASNFLNGLDGEGRELRWVSSETSSATPMQSSPCQHRRVPSAHALDPPCPLPCLLLIAAHDAWLLTPTLIHALRIA
jgi:hypothetical protein